MKRTSRVALTIGIVGLALVLMASTGCKKKKGDLTPPVTNTATTDMSGTPGTDPNALPEFDPNTQWTTLEGASPIYYDYDSSSLRADALAQLKVNADAINAVPADKKIMVEGHCDERGTQEYNLALGERRAQAARDHLLQLGIPADRVLTVSYGEEQPAVAGSTEDAYAQNRRAEFKKSL
ncbi:MAG: OmpA family protein [FCB group bacterium]|nr:OmpA family protein [FCB group bacterium]